MSPCLYNFRMVWFVKYKWLQRLLGSGITFWILIMHFHIQIQHEYWKKTGDWCSHSLKNNPSSLTYMLKMSIELNSCLMHNYFRLTSWNGDVFSAHSHHSSLSCWSFRCLCVNAVQNRLKFKSTPSVIMVLVRDGAIIYLFIVKKWTLTLTFFMLSYSPKMKKY